MIIAKNHEFPHHSFKATTGTLLLRPLLASSSGSRGPQHLQLHDRAVPVHLGPSIKCGTGPDLCARIKVLPHGPSCRKEKLIRNGQGGEATEDAEILSPVNISLQCSLSLLLLAASAASAPGDLTL